LSGLHHAGRPVTERGEILGQGHDIAVAEAGRPAAHLRWLATLKMAHATQQIGFQEYLHAITEATARIARLEQAMRDALPEWTLRPLVQAQIDQSLALAGESIYNGLDRVRELMAMCSHERDAFLVRPEPKLFEPFVQVREGVV
jgi:hypothetical protein